MTEPTALDVIVVLEDAMQKPVERGWCPRCGFEVRLTPKKYLKAHAYFRDATGPLELFSYRGLRDGPRNRVIISCSGGGMKPRKTKP